MNIIINNLQKADTFAAIFQHIKLMTDNINIMFEKDRLYVQSMDSARVSIFEINIHIQLKAIFQLVLIHPFYIKS